MEEQQAFQVGFFFGFVFVRFLIGFLCGLLPWFYGRHRGMNGVASAGMLLCTIMGFIGGLIAAVPTAVVFAIVIAVLPAAKKKGRPKSFEAYKARTPGAPYEI